MKTKLIKKNRNIVAFIGTNSQGYYFAFGNHSHPGVYIAFGCKDEAEGVQKIESYMHPTM